MNEEIEVLNEPVETLEMGKETIPVQQVVVQTQPIQQVVQTQPAPQVQKNPSDAPSMIEMYGEVLTDKQYITNPAVAREEEINKMILALVTPDKSAILVGKPGIGKTALVEGLAYRIHQGNVPNAIQGWKIIKINIPALLGKIDVNGIEVSKIQLLINEIDNLEKTILFIDEIHLLVAHNNGSVDLDFGNMLKPYLDRGRILMIGATTDMEYEQYVLRDRAFVRRFIKIEISELQGEDVVKVLMGTYPKFEAKMGVKFKINPFQLERVFAWMVEHTTEYKRIYEVQNRYPDICLTIVSSAFSYALLENASEVTYKHIYLAMKNTHVIYEDAKAKAIEDFKVRFANDLLNEGIDPNTL